jgi:hypothetical protein
MDRAIAQSLLAFNPHLPADDFIFCDASHSIGYSIYHYLYRGKPISFSVTSFDEHHIHIDTNTVLSPSFDAEDYSRIHHLFSSFANEIKQNVELFLYQTIMRLRVLTGEIQFIIHDKTLYFLNKPSK